jgi:hypothetical protein
MSKEGQCFGCYDNAMFQYHGQTGGFNPAKIQDEYVSKLSDGVVVSCVSCGRKVKYVKISENKWKEVVAD